jgi:superfamily II RNA helicase
MTTPAERFALAKTRGQFSETNTFVERYPFSMDSFQIQGCQALESG